MRRVLFDLPGRRVAALVAALLFSTARAPAGAAAFPVATNLSQFHQLGQQQQRVTCEVHLRGVIAWASATNGQFVLQDESGAERVDLGAPASPLQPGQIVQLDGLCSGGGVGSDRHIGAALIVDNDGMHEKAEKSASVFLSAGLHPTAIDWFNRDEPGSLEVDYAGPELARQVIPASALFHDPSNTGLVWESYEGEWWQLPDFTLLTPAGRGVASNVGLGVFARPQFAAVRFHGFLQIPRDGVYTFSTISEGGSQLWMNLLRVTVEGLGPPPQPRGFNPGRPAAQDDTQWASVEGMVDFADAAADSKMSLELVCSAGRVRVDLSNRAGLTSSALLNSRVRVTGLCRGSAAAEGRSMPCYLWAPGAAQIEIINSASARDFNDAASAAAPLPTLTTVEEIKRLKRSEALRGYPVRVRGVITWSAGSAVVIQDATAGIFVSQAPVPDADGPRAGELWEIEGVTYAQFSPMILARKVTRLGLASLPEPLHPTWDELINGSLDTQFVEVRGVVTDVHGTNIILLTHGGRIEIDLPETRPEQLPSFRDALVRIRGCLWAVKDDTTHLIKVGAVQIHNAAIAVDQPAPADPFDAPVKTAASLLLFDARAGALQRVKVAGQVLQGRAGEYFLADGTNGLRFVPKSDPQLVPGDLVEVVGFPDLNGPSPALREAIARKTGHAALPAPAQLSEETLVAGEHDAALVKVEARLVKASIDAHEATLRMQAGPRTFIARLVNKPEFAQSLQPGSLLEMTGVYVGRGGDRVAGRDIDSFELLVNAPSDIRVLSAPPWWTLRRLLVIVGLLAGALGIAGAWIGLLRRKVEQRTSQLRTEIQERERAEHQRVVEAERSRIARDLHDDLGASLTEISLLADAGPGAPPTLDRAAQRFHRIGERARAMVSALDVIVWLVNPRKDVLPFLVGYLGSYAEEYLSACGIGCRLKLPIDVPAIPLSADVRHSVFLAVREALHNIVQHAHASEVVLEISVSGSVLRITVLDNGQGFDAASARNGNGNGNGLSNLRERLAGAGGECQILARPEQGARVVMTLPLPAPNNHL